MSQSWKMRPQIEAILISDRAAAISQLSRINQNEIASELHDLYKHFQDLQRQYREQQESITKLRSAMTYVLSVQGRKYDLDEFEKACQNDQKILQTILGRVRIDQKQPEDNSNSNNQPNGKQNQIDQLTKKINFQKDQINQFKIHQNSLNNINKQILEDNAKYLNDLIQLQNKQIAQNNEMGLILIESQLQSVNQNSINIEIDCQQFKEKIENINNEREQLIRKMEETLTLFKQIQSQNILQQNMGNQSIDVNEFSNIINKIRDSKDYINRFDEKLKQFIQQIDFNPENKNNDTIKDLLTKLNGNRQCFTYIQIIFEKTLKMLEEIQIVHEKQNDKNKQLQKQLEEMEKQNNKIKKQLQDQINQLKEYNKNEQQIFSNDMIKLQCVDISNKYAEIYYEFYDYVKQKINQLFNIILILFPNENELSNIQPNSELLQDIRSFINSIHSQNINNDSDCQDQQWQRSIDLFKKIYPTISNNSKVNEYIIKSVDRIDEIRRKIKENKENFDRIKNAIERNAQRK